MVYKLNYSLRKFNTWRIGGEAEKLFIPNTSSQFIEEIKKNIFNKSMICLGLGSNVLIRDGGISGLVCITYPGLSFIEKIEQHIIRVGAGTPCAQVARFCAKQKLTGLEFLVGVPGTIGGALVMNAGAFGVETWDHIKNVEVINNRGDITQRSLNDFIVGYREIGGLKKNEWFLSAEFKLEFSTNVNKEEKIRLLLKKRSSLQPIGLPSCGSVFKNSKEYKAARLIDGAGLKGYRIEKAYISSKHANFIITEKGASAEHVELLMNYIIHTVQKRYGIDLKPEVKILGNSK